MPRSGTPTHHFRQSDIIDFDELLARQRTSAQKKKEGLSQPKRYRILTFAETNYMYSRHTYLRHGHHNSVAWAPDGGAQDQSHRFARAVGEENVVRAGAVAIAALDKIAHLLVLFASRKPTERGGGTSVGVGGGGDCRVLLSCIFG